MQVNVSDRTQMHGNWGGLTPALGVERPLRSDWRLPASLGTWRTGEFTTSRANNSTFVSVRENSSLY